LKPLFIEDAGLWLSVRGGMLAIRQRDGHYIDVSHKIKTIVAAGHGFAVTSAAVRYCGARHIELLISDDVAAFVSLFAPEARGDSRRAALKVRERQFRAALDKRKTVEIARAIVAKKIGARPTLVLGLSKARTNDQVRLFEARADRIWWTRWEGFRMSFAGAAVPADWGRYIGRRQGRLGELGAKFTARGAVHPMQAMHNFATAIVTARLARAIVARGLDPCFGFLHEGRKQGRLSLVWDAIEPLRPRLVSAVFGYAANHEFEKKDFLVFVHKRTREKTVRLAPPLAKEIAVLALKTVSVRECVRTADWLVKLL
jgi:CRISPR-associated endonuclease Cas1